MRKIMDLIDIANDQAALILERQIALAQKPIKPYICENKFCGAAIHHTAKIKRWCEECVPAL